MAALPIPVDEIARLSCLPDYDVMGTAPEVEYDDLTSMAADIFGVSMCLVTIIGKDQQWVKSHWGLDFESSSRDVSFCTHTILSSRPLVVCDTLDDERFRENPFVTGDPHIRFYAGAPLINSEGIRLGAFCLLDQAPRETFSKAEIDLLTRFARMVSERLDLRRAGRKNLAVGSFAEASGMALVTADAAGMITFWNAAAQIMFGYDRGEAIGNSLQMIMPARFRADHNRRLAYISAGGKSSLSGKSVEVTALHRDGHEFPIELAIATWQGRGGVEFGAHIQDISGRRAREYKLQHLASHDGLTGLLNKRGFQDKVETRFRKADGASLLMIDLDGFKKVNDTLGHPVGDALLQALAVRMTACISSGGILARIGGDEFGVLLSCGDDVRVAVSAARDLLAAFAEPFQISGHELLIGASIGIAVAPLHAQDSDELIIRADLALLRAKNEGGRAYRLFDAGMANQLAATRQFKDEMRQAYIDGQWVLYYQPQVRLSDGRLIGAEALLRWQHPTRGLLAPAAFLSILETHLLAYDVGRWVVEEACRQLAEWRADGILIERVSVNLFAAQLRGSTLESTVGSALRRHGLLPQNLELEITETIVLNHDDAALEPLRNLHRMGVAIAFDDFGTGFASLSTLKRFPLSRMKIDKSFIADICSDLHSVAIVRAVAAMGQSLGLRVIAEGIETLDQASTVIELGCGEGQGYLYGRPMHGSAFAGRYSTVPAQSSR